VIAANLATYGHPTSTVPMGSHRPSGGSRLGRCCARAAKPSRCRCLHPPSSFDGHESDHHHGCRAHLPPDLRAMTTVPPKVGLNGCARTWAIGP
jgi:hypothetical protein